LESLVELTTLFWRNRPTFITGGTGLVGSWLVKALLAQGADIVCLVRDWVPSSLILQPQQIKQVRIVRGDVRDQRCVERVLGDYEVKTVIHLAAQTIVGVANRNPIETFESNIQGTWCLLEACRRSPLVEQVVIASSDKAYGIQESLPYQETAPLQGRYPYDVSKSCTDLIAQSYAYTYGLPVVIARCGNFYGGGDLNWNRLVPGTIRSIINQENPRIRSNGQFIRDYLYVKDGANAYLQLAEALERNPSLKGEAFNFSLEINLNVLELVEKISTFMNSDLVPLILNEVSSEIPVQFLSSEKARRILGWEPFFSLESGLLETIQWYREFLAHE